MSIANSVEAGNGQDRTAREIKDWYAGFTHRESNGVSDQGVAQWAKSPLDEVKAAVVTHRKDQAVVVPEFPVKQADGSEVAVSLKVLLHRKPGFSSFKDVSLAVVTRNPNKRDSQGGIEVQPIENADDLVIRTRPEVLKGLAENLRGVPVARPVRLAF